jgi:hypothetical protein
MSPHALYVANAIEEQLASASPSTGVMSLRCYGRQFMNGGHGVPTGAAAAFIMQPTTTLSASSCNRHRCSPDGRDENARLRISWLTTVILFVICLAPGTAVWWVAAEAQAVAG